MMVRRYTRALGEKTTHNRGLFAVTPTYSVQCCTLEVLRLSSTKYILYGVQKLVRIASIPLYLYPLML